MIDNFYINPSDTLNTMYQLRLPLDYPRQLTQTTNYKQEIFDIFRLQGEKLGDSLPFFFLAIWGCLVYRYHQEETIISVGFDSFKELEDNQSYFDFSSITLEISESTDFEYLFNNIERKIGKEKKQSNVAFLNSCLVDLGCLPNHFDLILCVDSDNNLHTNNSQCKLIYNSHLFNYQTINRIINHFKILFNSVVDAPQQRISKLALLTADEKNKILHKWNEKQINYNQNKCIHQLFEEQVKKNPDQIAVIFENEQLTYKELNQKANQLANYLQTLGVDSGEFIGLFLEASLARIIGLLGILKAGGVYLPLDPTYPQERLKFMMEDSHISILLTQEYLNSKLSIKSLKIINLDTDWEKIEAESFAEVESNITEENLAYIIYTSGSTGIPKGVLINHQALSYHCQNMIAHYKLNLSDRVLQFASFSFDVSLEQILPTLAVGATLILVDAKSLTPFDLNKTITNFGLTVVNFPPVYLTQWLQFLEDDNFSDSSNQLRLVISGGESLPLNTVKKWYQSPLKDITLLNAYGPTETTITAITFEVPKDPKSIKSYTTIPIGFPLPNRKTYILDRQKNPVPIGVAGELYIGGEGLACGYLNQLELTKKKFINNPFGPGKLYKTGDLARYLPDGNIEFLGRIDNQVKLRGFRIELGEIETILTQHFQVREAKVMLREDSYKNRRLVAYIIPNSSQISSSEMLPKIREYLKQQLPNYMIPSALIVLETFPLTPNGKIDYRAFPKPDFSTLKRDYISPSTPEEKILANLWSQVLKIEKIGINDNFFELGGHSLLATQLISLVRDTFEVEIAISVLFECSTIAQLSKHLKRLDKKENTLPLPSIKPQEKEGNIPLSFSQKGIWFLEQLNPNNSAYNLSFAFQIEGKIDLSALEKSFNEIIKRHENLRTNFIDVKGNPVQDIKHNINFKLSTINLEHLASEKREIEAKKIVSQVSNTAFNLAEDCLFRVKLLQLKETNYILLINVHHIIFDGWSWGIILTELKNIYRAYCNNLGYTLSPLPIQYSDFSLWQKTYLTGDRLESQLNYWQQKLRGALPQLELPTDYPRPRVKTDRGSVLSFSLPSELTTKIKSLSQKEGVSLFMTLLTAYKVLLYRYSGQEDIIIGTPIAGRNHREIEQLIGCFVNTLALRSDLSNNPSFRELLSHVKTVCLEAYNHQDVSFEKLVEVLKPERDLSYTPIFQVMFAFQNAPIEDLELLDLNVKPLKLSLDNTKFDLTLSLEESQGKLLGEWEYNTDLFETSTIERMTKHFQILLAEIVVAPQKPIGKLSLLSEKEKNQLLVEWNQTQSAYPQDICTHQLFEKQVKQTPEAIALVFEGEEISYQTLNSKANQLAYELQSLGVKLETVVGIYLESSVEMIITLLAILKVGGSYLPLDPSYPQERINYMLEDAQVSFLVSVRALMKNLPNYQEQVIFVDENKDNHWQEYQQNPHSNLTSNNLAYIIYTSGSTGKPKGVEIEHKSLINLLLHFKNQLQVTTQDSWLSVTTLSFDIAALEIFLPLITGGKLILASRQVARDGRELLKTLNQSQVTILQATPSTWQMLLLAGWKGTPNLTMLSGGEALSQELAARLLTLGYRLYNVYGPTETTIWSLSNCISNEREKITIGYPISNTEVYVLDTHLQPVPIGVPGELYIGGDGLARGYLKRPELTEEKFINSPFNPEKKLYKTGDLVCYRKDSKVEFLGRIDQQVKIRGFRIELGEIEAILKQHHQVKEVKVITKDDTNNQPQLVAYVIPNSNHQTKDKQNSTLLSSQTVTEIRQYLQQKLPTYMIPSLFVGLNCFPLTPNRKIDYRAFPEPDFSTLKRDYIAARTEIEEILTMIWSEVLTINNISIYDNFFELGGHSLLGTQIISRIRDQLNLEIPLYLLFECPTIAQFAEHIKLSKNLKNSQLLTVIKSKPISKYLPLSFAQEGLWFLTQTDPNSAAYHMPFIFKIQGLLDIVALEKSISKIVERHQILRASFIIKDGQTRQIINDSLDFNLPILDLDYLTEQEQDIEIIKITDKLINKPFNLEKYPLFRIQALHLKSDSYILLFNIHHIIFDGWSFNLFFTELKALYTAYMSNLSYSLPTLSIQYSDFSLWQKKCLENKILEPQFNYWKQQLDGILPILELPQDYPRPKSTTYEGATESFVLSPQLTKKLSLLAQQEGVSLFMLLLAVFQVLLCRYTGQEDVIVGTPIAGRKYQEFESLIGMFVNTLVIRTDLSNNPSFRELLKRVKQICLEAYSNQDVPFERLVEVLNPQRNLIYTPLFQVMFVLQNAPLEEQQLPGLTLTPVKQSLTTSKFDLTLFIKEENGQLIGEWEYKTNLFKSATIKRMIGHFQMLLSGISSNIEQTIWQLPLLTEPEEHQLLKKWNHTESNYPQTKSIHRLFEEQVNNNPNAIALVFEEQKITYQELNNKANQLAHYLRKLGVKIEQYIGLYLPPSLIRIVTLLAILKAGAVYVPLDPAYPQERVKFMIEDSGISILLSEQSLSSNLSLESLKIINLDTTWEDIERESMNNLENNITGKNLAYLIYTSGSTGQPKGVSILHQGVVRLVKNTNYITINSQDIFLQLASLSFDAATFEIWGCLLNGAKLIIFPLLLPTLDKIEKMIKENNISVLWLTSGLFNLIVDEKLEALQAVRYLLTGGDTLSVYHVKKFIESNVNCQLINGYGPTENTTFTCCHTIQEVTKSTKSIPIGRPIANTKVYILDTYLNPVPIGVRGELYIGGDGLAREYLNRPELTAKRFIASPFDSQERLYKTGDYARYLPDKNIEFLGRIDKQVKIRGFRVELGEIETALREYSDIRDAVVMTHRLSDQDKLLTAYIITENRELNKIKIQEYLKRKLPIYMIPSAFIFLDNFPLTRNKKIDYQSLPLPNFKASPNTKLHQKPEGQIESRLITIWKQTLRISFVNLEDNFFDIGGSSLVAMRLLSKIQQEFKININLSTFLQNPTIQYMTVLIREGKNITSESSLVPIKSQGSKPPLFFINSISQARKLGDYLDINQPFYVLNVFGITEFLKPQISSLSLEKIATKFIEDIENVQPTGPYYLVTYCADSFLTFEIAQQLKAKGKEIALLVFIDSIWKTEQFDLYWYWYNWQQFGLDYLRESLKNKLFYTQEKLRINLQQLQGKLLMNNKITLSRTLEDVRLLKAFEQAREEYSPQRYEGKVTLFLSKQYSLFYPSKIASLVTEGVEINEIPGYHSSLFKEPYIISLAKKLQTYL